MIRDAAIAATHLPVASDPTATTDVVDVVDVVDEWGWQSFPASDPPQNW